jgi:hypothetical protein
MQPCAIENRSHGVIAGEFPLVHFGEAAAGTRP